MTTTTTTARDARPSPGCQNPTAEQTTGRRTYLFAGVQRDYQLSLPVSDDSREPAPLILNIHGFTSNIDEQDAVSNLPVMGGARGYVVVTPQGEARTNGVAAPDGIPQWNVALDASGSTDDVHFLLDLIGSVETDLCIDTSRVFVAGVSNGAAMTMALRCAAGQTFAAVAPVAGVNIGPACTDAAPVPLITFHGTDDPLVPFDGSNGVRAEVDAISVANGCAGPPVETTPFDDARHTVFQGCPDAMDVELWAVIGGGHTWPGVTTYVDPTKLLSKKPDGSPTPSPYGLEQLVKHQTTDVVATTLMLDFFDSHQRS